MTIDLETKKLALEAFVALNPGYDDLADDELCDSGDADEWLAAVTWAWEACSRGQADPERTAQLIAHRACCGAEHDPANGKLHGCCVVCGVPWPCAYAGTPPAVRPELSMLIDLVNLLLDTSTPIGPMHNRADYPPALKRAVDFLKGKV